MISTSGTVVVGISLSGGTIPEGSGTLTNLSYIDGGGDVCITNIIISSPMPPVPPVQYNSPLPECDYIDIVGCTDPEADNYDPDADVACNGDNSCCEYSFSTVDYIHMSHHL